MTPHPGKTKAQKEYLDKIGCGDYGASASNKTINILIESGVIRQCGEKVFGLGWSQVRIPEYEMTIPAHMQWCSHQAEKLKKEAGCA